MTDKLKGKFLTLSEFDIKSEYRSSGQTPGSPR